VTCTAPGLEVGRGRSPLFSKPWAHRPLVPLLSMASNARHAVRSWSSSLSIHVSAVLAARSVVTISGYLTFSSSTW
jgi:hypothetical protein